MFLCNDFVSIRHRISSEMTSHFHTMLLSRNDMKHDNKTAKAVSPVHDAKLYIGECCPLLFKKKKKFDAFLHLLENFDTESKRMKVLSC